MRIEDIVLQAAMCTVCGALVPYVEERGELTPVIHDAPCGRACFGGGVSREAYMIGNVHRGDQCPCMESE